MSITVPPTHQNWISIGFSLHESVLKYILEIVGKPHTMDLYPDDTRITQIVTKSLNDSIKVKKKLKELYPNENIYIISKGKVIKNI